MLTRSKKAKTNNRQRAGTTWRSIFLIKADSLMHGNIGVTFPSYPI